MQKEKQKNLEPSSVSSEDVAFKLLQKMLDYQARIDRKTDRTAAEERHVAFLRALRDSGLLRKTK